MTDGAKALTAQAESVPLTRGLVRNTFFNLIGWAWPVLLAFVSIPYIVSGLGNDAYGIFGIVSIVAGYLGLLNAPVAMGNVRFMAEAFGRKDWDEFRKTVVAGVVIIGALAAFGSVIMFLTADVLARNVFKIPASLVDSATVAFRIAAASFFLNGIASALNGIPAAIRRYDILNAVNVTVGTLNTVGILLAIWLGQGLLGAVVAQLLSSVLAVVCFAGVAWLALRQLPVSGQKPVVDRLVMKQLVSFSALLFGGGVASNIGLQMDRTLIGILLGPTAVTFYTVPAKITEKIPGLMYNFALALYPLSAESLATDELDKLSHLYVNVSKVLLWISAFIATTLIVLSRELLLFWVGPEFATNSWLILSLLAVASVWRAPASVAYQVSNGLGRADVSMWMSWVTLFSYSLPVLVLVPTLGINGAALGVFLGVIPTTVLYDLFVQRRLLGQLNWRLSFSLYAKPFMVCIAIVALSSVAPLGNHGWVGPILKAIQTAAGFTLGVFVLDRPLVTALHTRVTHQLLDKG